MISPSSIDQPNIELLHPTHRLRQLLDSHLLAPNDTFIVCKDPHGDRQRDFESIAQCLDAAEFSRLLASISNFIFKYDCFTPDELKIFSAFQDQRNDEEHEARTLIQDCYILIQFDSMILQRTDLSESSRAVTVARIAATKAWLAHEEETIVHVNRAYGIAGAIMLDQE